MGTRADRWAVAAKGAVVALTASGGALLVTGIPLVWSYAPPDDSFLRLAHRAAGAGFVLSAVGFLGVGVLHRVTRRAPSLRWLAGLLAFGLAVVGAVTGPMIAWDQVGLWAVSIGDDWRGVIRAGSSDVRFVIVDGAEITPSTYRFWVIVHVLVVPVASLAIGAVATARRRREVT